MLVACKNPETLEALQFKKNFYFWHIYTNSGLFILICDTNVSVKEIETGT